MKLRPWILASRPKTLTAAAVPVLVGVALGCESGVQWTPAFLCLGFAFLIQIGTNFANDYYDYIKGSDRSDRIGPARAVASGWVRPEQMKWAMISTFGLAFLVGNGLVFYGGLGLVVVGILCLICGYAYTGGPYPLGYNGLGDLFVLMFFGWVATVFTFYLQTGAFSVMGYGEMGPYFPWVAGLLPGAMATNLLVVNNYRDEPQDRISGKRTLAVRWGRRFAFWEYVLLHGVSHLVPIIFYGAGYGIAVLSPLMTIPLSLIAIRGLCRSETREAYDKVLGLTALNLILQGILFSIGLIY